MRRPCRWLDQPWSWQLWTTSIHIIRLLREGFSMPIEASSSTYIKKRPQHRHPSVLCAKPTALVHAFAKCLVRSFLLVSVRKEVCVVHSRQTVPHLASPIGRCGHRHQALTQLFRRTNPNDTLIGLTQHDAGHFTYGLPLRQFQFLTTSRDRILGVARKPTSKEA